MLHLKKLSGAGITHVHLLPTFQFAGVHDDRGNWQSVGTKSLLMVLIFHLQSFSLNSSEVIISALPLACAH